MVHGKSGRSESSVEGTVASQKIYVSRGVGGQTGTAHPDSALAAVRRDVQHAGLGQRVLREAHDPTCVGPVVAMRSPGRVNDSVEQEQTSPFFILGRVEDHIATAAVGACAGVSGADGCRG